MSSKLMLKELTQVADDQVQTLGSGGDAVPFNMSHQPPTNCTTLSLAQQIRVSSSQPR